MLGVNIKKRINNKYISVNFKIKNEVLVVLGPSGSGKTTILNCISGIINPDEGEIVLENKVLYSSIKKINVKVKDRKIGYVFQDYALFPHMNIYNNIKYGLNDKNDKKVYEIMNLFKISHLKKRYPYQLSGGEKQRVALARSLLTKPKALLLDEPFSAVDKDIKQILYNEFEIISKELSIPIVLITHDEEEANRLGDKIYKIENQNLKLCI